MGLSDYSLLENFSCLKPLNFGWPNLSGKFKKVNVIFASKSVRTWFKGYVSRSALFSEHVWWRRVDFRIFMWSLRIIKLCEL